MRRGQLRGVSACEAFKRTREHRCSGGSTLSATNAAIFRPNWAGGGGGVSAKHDADLAEQKKSCIRTHHDQSARRTTAAPTGNMLLLICDTCYHLDRLVLLLPALPTHPEPCPCHLRIDIMSVPFTTTADATSCTGLCPHQGR